MCILLYSYYTSNHLLHRRFLFEDKAPIPRKREDFTSKFLHWTGCTVSYKYDTVYVTVEFLELKHRYILDDTKLN